MFLQGADAREASDGVEARPAREAVEELKVSGLGDAISVAIAVAQRMEADGLAEIIGVQTQYQEMSGIFTPRMIIQLRRQFRPSLGDEGQLSVATWNLAAINNNPFEYWISHSDESYKELMDQVIQGPKFTYAILQAPYCNCSIMGPQTLFYCSY